jgi:hypothetical protein
MYALHTRFYFWIAFMSQGRILTVLLLSVLVQSISKGHSPVAVYSEQSVLQCFISNCLDMEHYLSLGI